MKALLQLLPITLLLFPAIVIQAQWTKLAGFNQVVNDLHVHDDVLFICGGFTERDGQNSFRATQYDGTTFTDNTGLFGGTGLHKMAPYSGTVWATGGQGIYMWNGTTWSNTPANSASGILARQDTLYTGNDFGQVVRRLIGSSSFVYPEIDGGVNKTVSAIAIYQGQLIVGGNFESAGTTELNGMARWDGNAWQPMGSGLSSGQVLSMEVYRGDLIVAGNFTQIDGQSARNIAKWNGSSWSSVGGGNTGGSGNGIRDMLVHEDELYVCGEFAELGGTPARYVAKWDGTQWTPLDLHESSTFPDCIAIYNDLIYAGTFDFTDSGLYSRGLSTSVKEAPDPCTVHIFPNPASDLIHITRDATFHGDIDLRIHDAQGQLIHQDRNPDTPISCEDWPAGMYYLEVEGDGCGGNLFTLMRK